jgi:hypothetical protein
MLIPKTKAVVDASALQRKRSWVVGAWLFFLGGEARSLDGLGKSGEEVLRNSANQIKKLSLASFNRFSEGSAL